MVTKRIPCVKEECRKVCHKVTCYEDRVVNRTTYKTVQETCMKKQLVRLGHWECREVPTLFGGGRGLGLGGAVCSAAMAAAAIAVATPAATVVATPVAATRAPATLAPAPRRFG